MSKAILLRARGVEKEFKTGDITLRVLKGIHLDIEEGEAVCIVGESGSGKSTLLHILGTLDKPTSGRIHFLGDDLVGKTDRELARFRNNSLGFVFQFHHLLSEFTALENAIMPAKIAGLPTKYATSRARDLFNILGVSHRERHFPSQMSGGERQRVAVARALMRQPKILMADEPTGNLDSENSQKMQELFFDLQKQLGLTLLVVTHDRSMSDRFGRVLSIKDGQWENPELALKAPIS